MNTNSKTTEMGTKVKLSTLWIVVMFNMVFADILSFMKPEFLKGLMAGTLMPFQPTQEFWLVMAIFLEIPIAMILLSRGLKYKANRWANIIASAITIMFVVGGGSPDLHYIFFATVEVVCMLLIVWYAWKWRNSED